MRKSIKDKIKPFEYSRLPQMTGDYDDTQKSVSEKFAQDNLGHFDESEHQKPYENPQLDYQDLESRYTPFGWPPYSPSYPTVGKDEGKKPVTEVFNCWTSDCWCKDQLKEYAFMCTQPIYTKPWLREDLIYTTTVNSNKTSGTVTVSLPDNHYKFRATLRSARGTKVDVDWTAFHTCSPCVPEACGTEVISYTSLSLSLDGRQTLSITNQRMGSHYTWNLVPYTNVNTIQKRDRGWLEYTTVLTNRPIHAVDSVPTDGGSNYSIGDVLTLVETGASLGTVTVSDTTGGTVTRVTGLMSGTGYNTGVHTTTTTGIGTGCKINVTELDTRKVWHCAPATNRDCEKVDKITLASGNPETCCSSAAPIVCSTIYVTYHSDAFATSYVAGQMGPATIAGGCGVVGPISCAVDSYFQYLYKFNCYGDVVTTPGVIASTECVRYSLGEVLGDCSTGFCVTTAAAFRVLMEASPCLTRDDRTVDDKILACCPPQLI